MNKFPRKRPSDHEAIEAQAAAWLAQRDDGFTVADEAAFDTWCDADPRHAAAVARLSATWAALRQLRDFRPSARAHPDKDILAPNRMPRLLRFPRALQFAAAAALIILLAIWQWPDRSSAPGESSAEIYTTTVGGYQRVTLADGSILELNDSSEVRVRYDERERRLQLVHGQAHFTVAKNKSRPFLVQTPAVTVRAVGTAFDVRLGQEQVEVLVTEGAVRLDRAPAPGQRIPSATSDAPLLAAGWRATIPKDHRESSKLEVVESSDLRQALSWQGPRLVFTETPLAEVIEQFNRRNAVQMALGDPELAALPVGGSFRADNVDTFVRLLSSSGEIAAERESDHRIVLRKAR